MMPCSLPPPPAVLAENAEDWTRAWLARREADPSAAFHWPVRDGQPVHHRLLPLLLGMTRDHCAYCDGFPLDATGQPSIDHYRPKSVFPAEAPLRPCALSAPR